MGLGQRFFFEFWDFLLFPDDYFRNGSNLLNRVMNALPARMVNKRVSYIDPRIRYTKGLK